MDVEEKKYPVPFALQKGNEKIGLKKINNWIRREGMLKSWNGTWERKKGNEERNKENREEQGSTKEGGDERKKEKKRVNVCVIKCKINRTEVKKKKCL